MCVGRDVSVERRGVRVGGEYAGKYENNNTFVNILESFKLMKFSVQFRNRKLHRSEGAQGANGLLASNVAYTSLKYDCH